MAEARPVPSRVTPSRGASGDFTRFVRLMRDHGDEALEPEHFGVLWTALRRALRTELVRRGLWNRPPPFLGVVGYTRWTETDAHDDALDELTADCYSFVFLERMQALMAQLRRKPTIEGLVFRSIRNFLFERQRHADPIGFRVFGMLTEAVEILVERGVIRVEPKGVTIGNRAWLRFTAEPAIEHRGTPTHDEITTWIAAWSDDLLPALIVARGRERRAVGTSLADRLEALAPEGVARIRFRRVAEALRRAVRGRWAALLHATDARDGEPMAAFGRLVTHARPPRGFEARESFARLVVDVEQRIGTLDLDDAGRDYLVRLWSFARAIATETHPWPAARRYSRAAVARALSIPRNRMPALCSALEDLIETCRSTP